MKTKAHKSCFVIIAGQRIPFQSMLWTFFERKPLTSSFNQILTSHCTLKVTWTDRLAQPGWHRWCSHLLCVLWPCHPRECWPICCSKTAKHWKKGLKKLKSKESLIKMLHGWSVFRWIKQLWSFKKNMFSYSALFEFLVMQIWNFCLALALFHLLWINYRAQLVP